MGFLESLGTGIGKGAVAAGKGAISGVKKIPGALGKLNGEGMDAGGGMGSAAPSLPRPSVLTPGFNPGASMPDLSGVSFKPGAFHSDTGTTARIQPLGGGQDMQSRPAPLIPLSFPSQTMPEKVDVSPATIPSQVPNRIPGPQLAAPSADPTAVSAPSLPRPLSPASLDRRNVPIPTLPGQKGDPQPYNPYDAAKYDAVMADASPDKSKINRSWKTSLQSALVGAGQALQNNPNGGLGAALGGALGGGIGGTANPSLAKQMVFDAGPGRQMLGQQQRQAQQQAKQTAAQKAQADLEYRRAQIDNLNSDQYGSAAWGTYNKKTGEAGYEKALPTPKALPPHWQAVIGEDGQPRYVDLNATTSQGQTYRPIEKADAQRPFNVSPGGAVYDPKSQRELYRNPTQDKGVRGNAQYNAGVERAVTQYNKLKAEAAKADAASQANPNDADLFAKKQAALQALNSHVMATNETFGDVLEGGIGEKGYGYVKRKGGSAAPSTSPRNSGPTAKLSDLMKYLQ